MSFVKLCEDENISNCKNNKDDPIIKELEEKGVTKVIEQSMTWIQEK